MTKKSNPYEIIKHRYVTEKSTVLENLKRADSNPSLRACESPKYVFVVDSDANKQQIAAALEKIYEKEKIKVRKVNTVTVKPKKKRLRGKVGYKKGFKKAIVTLSVDDSLDQVD